MATPKDIKKRINAVKNTSKITKAMKMVAAAKLRRLQEKIVQTRPYADHMEIIIKDLSFGIEERQKFPLLFLRPRKTIEVLAITSDKGLCGAFNTNIVKEVNRHLDKLRREHFEVSLSVIGRRGHDFFRARGIEMRKTWSGLSGKIPYEDVAKVALALTDDYIKEEFDELHIIYNEFRSALIQKVKIKTLMPLELQSGTESTRGEHLYEPSSDVILNELLSRYVRTQLYRIILESNTSEEAARMVAMENATRNADEMIDTLTLEFNKARQAAITKEMLDIIGGAEAISK